jgi:hypothetical protein
MLKKWPDEYLVHKRHILEDADGNPDHINGTSIFKEKISTKKAKKIIETDFFVNMAQYMCVPRAGRHQSFADDDFRFGNVLESGDPMFQIRQEDWNSEIFDPESEEESSPRVCPLSWMDKAIILDPAPTGIGEMKRAPGSVNGLVVVGIDPWGRRYVLDAEELEVGPTELLRHIMFLCDKWGVATVGIEEVNFSNLYAPHFQYVVFHEYDWEPNWIALETEGQDKDARITRNLIRLFENHFIYFNQPTTKVLMQQLAEYPHGERKDLVDALSYIDRVISRPSTKQQEDRADKSRKRMSRDYGVSGYGF